MVSRTSLLSLLIHKGWVELSAPEISAFAGVSTIALLVMVSMMICLLNCCYPSHTACKVYSSSAVVPEHQSFILLSPA
ncbi:P44 outer membrane, C-terminal domain protein [Anaplasma phagocytophilum str. ApNP]|uniref:p44 outer membrane, C-terminal domain protein n=1 Tax=Anaplasma phagocytophilum str. ApNP TaxID=1359153 RepID=A0A0F3NFR6_ANAPH|nr:P44 outer membrane, C-terminal domain protein [Anaplasma phagocytophilum str. ApNP]